MTFRVEPGTTVLRNAAVVLGHECDDLFGYFVPQTGLVIIEESKLYGNQCYRYSKGRPSRVKTDSADMFWLLYPCECED